MLSIYDMTRFQPWSTIGAPPCIEQLNTPVLPERYGPPRKAPTKAYPWRQVSGSPMVDIQPLPDQPVTNQFCLPCHAPPGMSTEPIKFPNLVTGYDRNPQCAAKTALYTRYTPGEWINNCISLYSDSNINRENCYESKDPNFCPFPDKSECNTKSEIPKPQEMKEDNQAERLRNDAVRVMRETDEKTSQGQRDAGRRLGERLTDVTFWRNELNTELEKLITEIAQLGETKRAVAKALQDLEAPLHIAQECLYHRENRKGVEKVHDHVEKSLLMEVENLRNSQDRLRALYEKITKQLADNRAAQHNLEGDIILKESTLGIDSVCHQLNNYSRGTNYYAGIEKYDPTISTIESWAKASSDRINRSQTERGKSTQLRSDADTMINAVATAVWDHWNSSNNCLDRRSAEMSEAKSKIQMHLHRVQQEIFDVEKHMDLVSKAIMDKSNPLKVAQTRLEARSHRESLESCKDFAQMRIVQEVYDIHDSVSGLHRKMQDLEAQHQQLLKVKINLEQDLKRKVNALFIDREKCMGLRRSFPVNNMIKY